ncbi:MAG: DUF971 domain-containing protein [Clostridia bacterium]|nr:DUF971 domain-containing protein [Deltaproteobacteria bacterium]
MNVEPTEIEVESAAKNLRVAWSDNTTSRFPLRYLRGYCPCAACQGHGGQITFVDIKESKITGISEVGNYALAIAWRDDDATSHTTGIYSFDYLRDLDPDRGNYPRTDVG